MYFEIDNTPEHIRRARRLEHATKDVVKEECPRLILAPFSRPPQVVFDNVLIGTSCQRNLEILNPAKQIQQIRLGKSLPEGLVIDFPEDWLVLEPETCYCVTLLWTPGQPTAVRETIRFTNEHRGRYDVVLVLKSILNVKGKGAQPKGFKISPGKIKKKSSRKSPVTMYKKKSEIVYNTTQIKKTYNIIQSQQKISKVYNKENMMNNDYYESRARCPFGSPNSVELQFDTSEIFASMRKPDILQQTYDKSYMSNTLDVPNNILKPSNRQPSNTSGTDIFDNLTFTPLKTANKTSNLEKGPKIILSMNSESDLDDSLDMKCNKENQMHSILSITSTQANKWLTVNHLTQTEPTVETPNIQTKKQPNTSSPKELNSPNFSINTDFSRISDLSFFPQRYSTEKKCFPKMNNDTHEICDDSIKLSTDTFTKESPFMRMEPHFNNMYEMRPPHFFLKDQPKMCRQSLFKDQFQQQRETFNSRNYLNDLDHNVWQNDLRHDVRSPPRSITPPLQSIPEESVQLSNTQILDRTKQQNTFTINRTFDKTVEWNTSVNKRQSWSKKSIRAEPDLWKIPISHVKRTVKNKSTKNKDTSSKISNTTFETDKSFIPNISVNQFGNVYSQSTTVDPFLSTTYFYDEEAVDKFETEFKRWLNCILTPPADLDSNIEMKIDVGKAWIENRNKEVPAAPTKEQVSSAYHNSHRLESLRRTARALLMSPEISQVIQKLNLQIDKKLIAIRNDRNLHLDVGLQKAIMELLLSYNPLWLRIGLEAIYGLVMPLKSNSDIDGLTTFIIQRMFKNPFLKNKHSKSSAPNMLLPAYMEAMKKFTLKKFFMLVFFLDQAKQKKIISHDPCLFCRNAVCKESREVVIRFTRELIAGIGDITRHLRPLGYVVCHKQSYLDEYKYAVHNIALDIRDGVRLTKVMEIIMIKDGLLNQLRTPAISRLQKIHNVQVALNALKEANFAIVGDITANDIADGHREKTLSLLWQIIHVFRAPLFVKAANVIQTWWRKKYEVIVEKKREAERVLQQQNNAASAIQCWWRRIQYNRLVEWKMEQVTTATTIIQKYCRKWLCRSRLIRMKRSVIIIEKWYKTAKSLREAKLTLQQLRLEREKLRARSAIVIQTAVRRWLCMRQFKIELKKIVLIQSLVRRFLLKNKYVGIRKATVYVQQVYKGKLLMRKQMEVWNKMKISALRIQTYYRMVKQRNQYLKLKKSVQVIENRYSALVNMRTERKKYLVLKQSAIKVQALFRSKLSRQKYLKERQLIILLQNKIRANQLMKKEQEKYLKVKQAAQTIKTHVWSYITMKKIRKEYDTLRETVIKVQALFRTKVCRQKYIKERQLIIELQRKIRANQAMRNERENYLKVKQAAITIKMYVRSYIAMKKIRKEYVTLRETIIKVQSLIRTKICREKYLKERQLIILLQRKIRANQLMMKEREKYLKIKHAAETIKMYVRSYITMKKIRKEYVTLRETVIMIQALFRTKICRQKYLKDRQLIIELQRKIKANQAMKKERENYLKVKQAAITIKMYVRSYIAMKKIRKEYVTLRETIIKVQSLIRTKICREKYLKERQLIILLQRKIRANQLMMKERENYLKIKHAAETIKTYVRSYIIMKKTRNEYVTLRDSVIMVQSLFRNKICQQKYLKERQLIIQLQRKIRANQLMRKERENYLKIKHATVTIKTQVRSYLTMKKIRKEYVTLRESSVKVQTFYRSYLLAKSQRNSFLQLRNAVHIIQEYYRAHRAMKAQRSTYLELKKSVLVVQRQYRAQKAMKKQRDEYIKLREAVTSIQRRYRALISMRQQRLKYLKLKSSCCTIQTAFRAKKLGNTQQKNYKLMKQSAIKIQNWYRSWKITQKGEQQYQEYKKASITIQRVYKANIVGRKQRKEYIRIRTATLRIQQYYRSYIEMKIIRQQYIQIKQATITIQKYYKSYLVQKQRAIELEQQREIVRIRHETAAVCIQKYVRRYLVRTQYLQLVNKVRIIQELWRGKLITRLIHCEFLQKRRIIVKLQSVARGYLVRKHVQTKREDIRKAREEQRQHWAASKIQAWCRGHLARVKISHDQRVSELRRRWRDGGLRSTQETMEERNREAMEVLRNISDIETVIVAFKSLELLTEVFPMMYCDNASAIVHRVYSYMSVTNRSISSIEVLKSAAAILVNFTRYKVTGPKIYLRDRIPPILKFMLRFSNTETHFFCIMATYLWLFSKYEHVKMDLAELLNTPENHRMLVTIKGNVERSRRMSTNVTRNKFLTPMPPKFKSHTNRSLNSSVCHVGNCTITLPALEPDYGIVRVDKPRYFEDPQQAINLLFFTYKL